MAIETTKGFDALLPVEMAQKAEKAGVAKAEVTLGKLYVLSGLAGAFIAFGALFSTTVITGSLGVLPFGLTKLVAGVAFSIGLIFVVVGGAELFTGNNLIVMAWAGRKVTTYQVLRNWTVVYFGNLCGALFIAFLVVASGQPLFGDGQIAKTMLDIAEAKVSLGFVEAIILGVLCNVLVCLAVWMSYSARTTTDKILAVAPPITAFVACGFEHSVANMYFIPAGMLVKYCHEAGYWTLNASMESYSSLGFDSFLFGNLLPVTIGNIVGGAVLVGVVYWFVYLRNTTAE